MSAGTGPANAPGASYPLTVESRLRAPVGPFTGAVRDWADADPADLAAHVCDWDPLDLGVAHYVVALMDAGVHTFESCEGGDGHAFKRPTVRFYGDDAEGWRALDVCRVLGLSVTRIERAWDMEDDGEPSDPYWLLVLRRWSPSMTLRAAP